MKKLKIIFINPRNQAGGLSSVSIYKWPAYNLFYLASLTPENYQIKIIDERKEKVNFNEGTDLVALTATTSSVKRAYEIARQFKNKGIKVIMGGVHVSHLQEEALAHVDSVVVGEADLIWPEILSDFSRNNLKRKYFGKLPDNLDITAKRSINETSSFSFLSKIFSIRPAFFQASRGCPIGCDFCSVTDFNGRISRTKSIPFLIQELKKEKEKGMTHAFFIDDNIMANKEYAKNLFQEMRKLKIQWVSQTDLRIADDDVMDLACQRGVVGCFLGLESLDSTTLGSQVSKAKHNWRPSYEIAIAKLRQRQIWIEGAFIFGLDGDTKETIKSTVDWALNYKLDLAQFAILTPLPGTKLFNRLEREGRIITRNWDLYNLLNCVYIPKNISKQELEHEIKKAYKQFYSFSSIIKRLRPLNLPVTLFSLLSNLEFRRIKKMINYKNS